MSAARPWDYEIWPHVSRRAAARAGFVGARHQRVLRASATRDASPLQHSLRCDTACPGEKLMQQGCAKARASETPPLCASFECAPCGRGHGHHCSLSAQPKSDLSDFGQLKSAELG